jgi:hypothetical protein
MTTACAWEKFQGATLALVRAGSIKDRLVDAYRNHLCDIAADELPKEFREEFRALQQALTREPPLSRGEDAIRATVRKMSNDEADRMAASVVHLFGALARPAAPALRAVPSSAQVVPLYVAEA